MHTWRHAQKRVLPAIKTHVFARVCHVRRSPQRLAIRNRQWSERLRRRMPKKNARRDGLWDWRGPSAHHPAPLTTQPKDKVRTHSEDDTEVLMQDPWLSKVVIERRPLARNCHKIMQGRR
eukprot:8068803-Pyramimonas_sp.AAC.1